MGKKKGKKGKKNNDWDDDDLPGLSKQAAPQKKKSGGGGGFDDGFEDDFEDDPAPVAQKNKKRGKKKGKKGKKGGFDDDDGFEDEAPSGAPAKPRNTGQDDAFKRFQKKAAAGKTQTKTENKKAAGKKAAGFAAFAAFADEDQDDVDDMSGGDESSSEPYYAPEPVQKKQLTKKEKRKAAAAAKRAAAAEKADAEDDWDAILEAETGAAAADTPEPEPEPPKEEPKPQAPTKKLTKAQKKKLKKKQEYEKKKAAKEKKEKEAAELDALLAGEGGAEPKPKEPTTPPVASDAETKSPEPPADSASPEPEVDDGQPKEMTKNQKKALKKKQKKAEEKRLKAEKELKKKEKKEKDYLDKAEKAHAVGDYKNTVSYLDFLDRSKPEYFGEQSKELRAKIEKEQDNYKKAEEMTTKVIFEKDFQKIDVNLLKEAVALLEDIGDAPILQQNKIDDQNDGEKTKSLLEVLSFRLMQFESQEAKAAKRRAKREAKKLADKKGGKGGKKGPDARTLAMMKAMGIDPSKRGKRGKQDRKKNKKKGARSFKNQDQIEQEQREEAERYEEAERKRKEEEERRLQQEKEEAEEKERQRVLRIQKEEEARQEKQEAIRKRREEAARKRRKDSDSDGDWENSGDDGNESSPKKGKDGEEGWEDSADDTDDNDQKRSPEDDEGDENWEDGSGSEEEAEESGGDYGMDAAYVPGDNDFQDAESDGDKSQNGGDSKRGSGDVGGKGGLSKKEANKLQGQAAVEARRAAKLVEEAKQRDTKFRIGINKILKRNDKDWRKQIRKLPERKAYKALFELGDYANHPHKKTLLRDMIADKIAKADDNWEALNLPESVTLLELRVKASLDELSDKRIKSNLRSPIGVIMGHVDTGKTKILDYIRKTKVQDNEAGGITQQIGATFLPIALIKEKAAMVQVHVKKELTYDLPGLLIIDTPGHESFSNLRARGSSLCDIAVLVIDIMHGLEPQTIESIKMLQKGNHPFIIALNKIDRCYGWTENVDFDFQSTIAKQPKHTQEEFGTRSQKAIAELAEQLEINADLWWKVAGKDYTNTTLIVPTSAHTGEGLPDLLMLLVQLTQRTMDKQLQYISSLRATILEVKTTVGHGYTLDVVLQNGFINRGDTIVVCGMEGAIKTQIRALLVPAEGKEMRVKGDWGHVDQIQAAAGVRISAPGLEKAIAGSELLVVPPGAKPDVVEGMMDQVQAGFSDVMSAVDTAGMGVFVVASTLGALEALIQFLNVEQKIPICGISIGTVYKKQVMKAAVMLEKKEEYACILAFNVAVDPEAEEHAAQMKVRIFRAEIIYNLFDDFKDYLDSIQADRRADTKDDVVFPVKLQIFEDKIFRARDPLIMGVKVISGTLRKNTPLVAMKFTQTRKGRIAAPFPIGFVVSMENEGKIVEICEAGDEVAVKIDSAGISPIPMYQRHFDYTHSLYSRVSRRSLDVLKETYREEAIKHLALLKHMKQLFNII